MDELHMRLDPAVLDHPIFASPAALVEAVLKTCDTYPDRVNPKTQEGCVYDDGHGNHCLIGQTLVDNDLPLPVYNTGIYTLCDRTGLRQHGDAVSDLQYQADAAWGGEPPAWAEVAAIYRKEHADV